MCADWRHLGGSDRIKYTQVKVMKQKDERVKQLNEVLSGIRVVKLYAWENSFMENLSNFRNKELGFLNYILNMDAVQTFLWNGSPLIVACVTFAVYTNIDSANILTAEKAFVSISLFNLLRFPLNMLPSMITTLVLTLVSSRRLAKFLNNDELVRYVTREQELEAVSIEGGTLSWTGDESGAPNGTPNKKKKKKHPQEEEQQQQLEQKDSQRIILRDIDLHVKRGSFVAIVGQVASGKSSLLAAILGEMHRISGRFNVCKGLSMAYVPQQAWIQNMTVRDNITFGTDYDSKNYERVLTACSLGPDLETLPGGDQAEIGEKGINLSGGQKQRVSLARACYSQSDIYLLDDPLSALDSHVSKHVFENVLSSTSGLLKNRTRVLATNSLFVLPHVDQIVVLEAGKVVERGTYKELMANEQGHLVEFMRQYSASQTKEEEKGPSSEEGTAHVEPESPVAEVEVAAADSSDALAESKSAQQTLASVEIGAPKSKAQKPDIGKLIEVERIEWRSVPNTARHRRHRPPRRKSGRRHIRFRLGYFFVMDGLDRDQIPVQSTRMYHYNRMNTSTLLFPVPSFRPSCACPTNRPLRPPCVPSRKRKASAGSRRACLARSPLRRPA